MSVFPCLHNFANWTLTWKYKYKILFATFGGWSSFWSTPGRMLSRKSEFDGKLGLDQSKLFRCRQALRLSLPADINMIFAFWGGILYCFVGDTGDNMCVHIMLQCICSVFVLLFGQVFQCSLHVNSKAKVSYLCHDPLPLFNQKNTIQ